MDNFKFIMKLYFNWDFDFNDEDFAKGFFTQSEVWDIKQCDVCKETVIAPYNCNLMYHISKKHYVQGNFISILEKNKPVTLKNAFENFRIDGFYYLSDKEFEELKNFLISKKIIDKTKK